MMFLLRASESAGRGLIFKWPISPSQVSVARRIAFSAGEAKRKGRTEGKTFLLLKYRENNKGKQ